MSRPGDAAGYASYISDELDRLIPNVTIHSRFCTDADLVFVLIGPRWLELLDAVAQAEIAQALALADRRKPQVTVVPLLLRGGIPAQNLPSRGTHRAAQGGMPRAEHLPHAIGQLAECRAEEIRHGKVEEDLERLLAGIRAASRGSWQDGGSTCTLRIVSRDPGMIKRAVGRSDGGHLVPVQVDEVVHGMRHFFGDGIEVKVAPGKHQVLLRHQFEAPLEVEVAEGRVTTLHVERGILTKRVSVRVEEG